MEVVVTERALNWRTVKPAPLILLSGPEDAIARCAVARIRAVLRAADAGTEVDELDAGTYSAGALLTLASPSLFAEPRLVLIDRGESMNDAFVSDALTYGTDPQPDAVVVLRHRNGVRGKKVLSAWTSAGCAVVRCDALKRPADRAQFVSELLAARARSAERAAVQKLAEIFAGDADQLLGAVAQLLDDVEGTISVSDVERYFGGRGETTGFAVADAAFAGDEGRALILLRQAYADGVPAVPLLGAIVAKVRTVAGVHGLDGAPAALAGRVGAAPWQVKRAQAVSQRWPEEALAAAVRALAATDARIKGGAADPEFQLERLVRSLARRTAVR